LENREKDEMACDTECDCGVYLPGCNFWCYRRVVFGSSSGACDNGERFSESVCGLAGRLPLAAGVVLQAEAHAHGPSRSGTEHVVHHRPSRRTTSPPVGTRRPSPCVFIGKLGWIDLDLIFHMFVIELF
jgi:hypothetical protein